MKGFVVVVAVAAACAMPLAARSQQVITGEKFDAFRASSAKYMNVPVTLEGTFGNIVESFNEIEAGNNYSPDMYVKFSLGQSPYPCIGMRVPQVMNGLVKCAPGDLVRVTGNLRQIDEKPRSVRVRGKFLTGPTYRETVHVYGPRESETFFNVSSVEKGWGKQDSAEEMLEEGKSLSKAHYQEVTPAEIKGDPGELVCRAVWFQDEFEGVDENRSELEKAAGITGDNVIKFTLKESGLPCYIQYSKSNLEGLKNLPAGAEIQVFGRIRKKETPKGWIAGIAADRIMKIVTKEEAPAPQASEEEAPAETGPPPLP